MKIRVFGLGDLNIAKDNWNFKHAICFFKVFYFILNASPAGKTYQEE
jgi:hypothetical protein